MQTEAAAETGTPADKAEPQPRPGRPPCPRRGAGGSGGAVRPAAWVAVCGGRHVRSLGELQPPRRPGPPTPRSCLTCVFQGQQARELGRGRGEQAGTGVRPQRGLARPDACARRGAVSHDLGRPCCLPRTSPHRTCLRPGPPAPSPSASGAQSGPAGLPLGQTLALAPRRQGRRARAGGSPVLQASEGKTHEKNNQRQFFRDWKAAAGLRLGRGTCRSGAAVCFREAEHAAAAGRQEHAARSPPRDPAAARDPRPRTPPAAGNSGAESSAGFRGRSTAMSPPAFGGDTWGLPAPRRMDAPRPAR